MKTLLKSVPFTKKLSVFQGETTEKGANCGTETHSVGVGTNSVAVATDPDCLGPCEPGTHVMLEGIVWNETENGEQELLDLEDKSLFFKLLVALLNSEYVSRPRPLHE